MCVKNILQTEFLKLNEKANVCSLKFGLLESSRANSDFLLYLRISNDGMRLILTSLHDLIIIHFMHRSALLCTLQFAVDF